MTAEPAPHTSLSDRAIRWWAHVHQAILVGKGLAVIALVVGIVFVLVEVYAAIKHSSETRAEQKIAQTVPQTLQTAPLEHHLFRPNQKPLVRHTFKALPLRPGDPLPRPPVADSTPAIPHPDVTTKTADTPPVATVFDPQSPADASELSTKFGIDLDRYFLISERKAIPALENGAVGIMVLPAGGGDAEFKWVENKRPTLSFRPAFKLGGGWHRTWSDPRGTVQGFHLLAGIEPLRVGGVHVELLTFVNFDKGQAKPVNGSAMVNGYWLWK